MSKPKDRIYLYKAGKHFKTIEGSLTRKPHRLPGDVNLTGKAVYRRTSGKKKK